MASGWQFRFSVPNGTSWLLLLRSGGAFASGGFRFPARSLLGRGLLRGGRGRSRSRVLGGGRCRGGGGGGRSGNGLAGRGRRGLLGSGRRSFLGRGRSSRLLGGMLGGSRSSSFLGGGWSSRL